MVRSGREDAADFPGAPRRREYVHDEQESYGRVDEYEPNRKLTIEATSGAQKGSTISYILESIGGGKARFREVVELRPGGFIKLIMPFVAGRIKRMIVADAEGGFSNMRHILESEAHS
jgi:hypothetical protein